MSDTDKKEYLTFTLDGSSVAVSGECSISGLLGIVDAAVMLTAERLELPVNDVLDNFRTEEEAEGVH